MPSKPVPKAEIENINKIEKKSHRIKKMASYPQAMPIKNKDGRNIKQHFGTWKYFLKGKLKKEEESQKQKFYITLDCHKMPEMQAFKIATEEAKKDRHLAALRGIKEVGLKCNDPHRLEYWGLPEGICQ